MSKLFGGKIHKMVFFPSYFFLSFILFFSYRLIRTLKPVKRVRNEERYHSLPPLPSLSLPPPFLSLSYLKVTFPPVCYTFFFLCFCLMLSTFFELCVWWKERERGANSQGLCVERGLVVCLSFSSMLCYRLV